MASARALSLDRLKARAGELLERMQARELLEHDAGAEDVGSPTRERNLTQADIAMESLMASDPLHGRSAGTASALSSTHRSHMDSWAEMDALSAHSAFAAAFASKGPLLSGSGSGGATSSTTRAALAKSEVAGASLLRVDVGTVELGSCWCLGLPPSTAIALRYAVPNVGGEDVVLAPCVDFDSSGGFVKLNKASSHEMVLTEETLPQLVQRCLLFELVVFLSRSPRSHQSDEVALGVARLSWHELLLTPSHELATWVNLWKPVAHGATDPGDPPVARVHIKLSLQPAAFPSSPSGIKGNFAIGGPASLMGSREHDSGLRGLHLRVYMGRLRLRVLVLRGVKVVLKLGLDECAIIEVPDLSLSSSALAEAALDRAVISRKPIWLVDPIKGVLFDGLPTPRLFLELWHGSELFALGRVTTHSLLHPHATLELCRCAEDRWLEIADVCVELQSTSSGAAVGTFELGLQALGAGLAGSLAEMPATERLRFPSGPVGMASACACLRLAAASDETVSRIVASAAASCGSASVIPLDALRMALFQHMRELTTEEAATICQLVRASCGESNSAAVVHVAAVCEALIELRSRIDMCVDRIVCEAGPIVVEAVARDLCARGNIHVRLLDLSRLIGSLGGEVPMDSFRRLAMATTHSVDQTWPDLELPAQPLVALIRKRLLRVSASSLDKRLDNMSPSGFSLPGEVTSRLSSPLHADPPMPHRRCLSKERASSEHVYNYQGGSRPPSPRLPRDAFTLRAPYVADREYESTAWLRHSSHAQEVRRLTEDVKNAQVLLKPVETAEPLKGHATLLHLMTRVFEVVRVSGVDSCRAFHTIDKDGDGLVSRSDLQIVFQELGLSTGLAARELDIVDGMDFPEFERHYLSWLKRQPSLQRFERQLDGDGRAACLDLPCWFIFALLDPSGKDQITFDAMRRFVEDCLGFPAASAGQAAFECDLGESGTVAYRDFRKFMRRLDVERVDGMKPEDRSSLENLRASTRGTLELVVHAEGSEEAVNARGLVADTLKNRGHSLDTVAAADGLKLLLDDLRVPSQLVNQLLKAASAISVVTGRGPSLTYAEVLDILRRAWTLLRGHLDPFYGACLAAKVDLAAVLDFALRRPTQTLTVVELADAAKAAGVKLDGVDLDDILRVLDPYHREVLFGPKLVSEYAKFRAKHGAIVAALACHLGTRQLSVGDLFSLAARAGPQIGT